MRNIECLVDVFYRMFEERDLKTREKEPEEQAQRLKCFLGSLDKKQKDLFYDCDLDNLEESIKREKSIIEFMLEALCSEEFFDI